MVLTTWKRFTLLASFLVCLFSTGCRSGADKIDKLLESLPTPPNASLLYKQGGERQGSQDSCYFLYSQRLYGTHQNFDQVIAFYTNNLDSTWYKRTDDLVPPNSPSWEKDKEFWLSLEPDPRLDFPKEVVSDAQSRYKTVYFLTVTYIDRIASDLMPKFCNELGQACC